MDKVMDRHVFCFNDHDNGGEALLLTTEWIYNGGGESYLSQELSLQSYCNCATFHLLGAPITPELLRQLANEMDERKIRAQAAAEAQHAANLKDKAAADVQAGG